MTPTQVPAVIHDPGTGGAPTSPDVPRTGRLVRYGRRARLISGVAVSVALLTGLVVLVSANTHPVRLGWAVGSTRAALIWIILAAVGVGWLLGIMTAIVFRRRRWAPR